MKTVGRSFPHRLSLHTIGLLCARALDVMGFTQMDLNIFIDYGSL
jgi:hypothetical protein